MRRDKQALRQLHRKRREGRGGRSKRDSRLWRGLIDTRSWDGNLVITAWDVPLDSNMIDGRRHGVRESDKNERVDTFCSQSDVEDFSLPLVTFKNGQCGPLTGVNLPFAFLDSCKRKKKKNKAYLSAAIYSQHYNTQSLPSVDSKQKLHLK